MNFLFHVVMPRQTGGFSVGYTCFPAIQRQQKQNNSANKNEFVITSGENNFDVKCITFFILNLSFYSFIADPEKITTIDSNSYL